MLAQCGACSWGKGRSTKRRPKPTASSTVLCQLPETQRSSSQPGFKVRPEKRRSKVDIVADFHAAWRKVLKDLINYFRELHKTYETRAKALMSTSNIINNTTIPPNFLSQGGIGDAAYILRDFHKQGLNEANKARDLENEVIIQLTGLRSDLQQKIKEIKSLSGDFKNSVDKEKEATKRAVQSLQEALGSVDHDAATTAGKGDPFLVKLSLDKQLEKQIDEENYLHRV
jgi:hypothetical protein